jgi:hypothetical protein
VSKAASLAFCREGGNRSEPQVDWVALEARLPKEVFEKFCDAVEIPEVVIEAHTEYQPNASKVMEALNAGDIDLEVMREVLIPGKWNTPKFVIRHI